MKLIINGIIRSLPVEPLLLELNGLLIGKRFGEKGGIIEEITFQNKSLFFHVEDGLEVIHGVKSIEIHTQTKSVKILSNNHHVYISFYQDVVY